MSVERQGLIPCCASIAVSLLLASSVAAQHSTGRLVFTVQPSAVAAGTAISPAVQVTVQDSAGQTVTGFVGPVTLAITDETGNAESELLGRATVAAVAGVATFPGLSIDSAGTGYTLLMSGRRGWAVTLSAR